MADFLLRTLITICSFPDNNKEGKKKMHEAPLKWKTLRFPSPSRFVLQTAGVYFVANMQQWS